MKLRNDWSTREIREIYDSPLLELIYRATNIHRQYNDTGEVQVCTLLSIKTVLRIVLIARKQPDILQELRCRP